MTQQTQMIGLLRPQNSETWKDPLWLRSMCHQNLENGFNFSLLPVTKVLPPGTQSITLADYEALPANPFSRKAHSALTSREWASFMAVIDNQSGCNFDRDIKARMLEEGAQWSKYLGIRNLILNLDWLQDSERNDTGFLAERIRLILEENAYEHLHLSIRMTFSQADWQRWNTFRNLVGPAAKNRLHVVLDTRDMIDADRWNNTFKRWFGESIQSILIPTRQFVNGPQGQPILPVQISAILDRFFDFPGIAWIIDGPELHTGGYPAYSDFMQKLESIHEVSELDAFLKASTDHLQRPLQPLHEQLHSSFYETFEKDPVKYLQYEKAVAQALRERHHDGQTAVVMVLGAGRGPLVDRVIKAAKTENIPIKIYIIEKNPTALVTLNHRTTDDWQDMDVTVVATDMRDWNAPEKADIIVSELLGSWGDNELSPECLDGADSVLKETGISIPASYTSWLAPITSARLHARVACLAPARYPQIDSRADFETQYVVHMGSAFSLTDEQPCFSFHHPNRNHDSNTRHISLKFTMPADLNEYIVHGFRGTFDCHLYGDHTISIANKNFSVGMFCWFPLYIPLETPVTLAAGESMDVALWRKVSDKHVWYEWQVKGHSPVYNPEGRSSTIELF